MEGTSVMTLGRLQPPLYYNPMPFNRTASPQQPQNLPRPFLQNGPSAFGRLRRFGNVQEVTALGNLGKVRRMLGEVYPGEEGDVEQLQQVALGMEQNEQPNYGQVNQQFLQQQQNAGMIEALQTWQKINFYLAPISAGVSAYHGYRRNQSWGWAIGWGLLGGLFPIITPGVALAQGFGKRKR